MTEHSETRSVPYPADLMYAVVADVGRYPEFLPWVTALRVLSRRPDGACEIVEAEMAVGYGTLGERYTSRVTLDPGARRIDVAQTSGPFRRLENHWRFTPEGEGCRVDFRIVFEFRNRLLGVVAGAAFERVMLKTVAAFEARAQTLSQEGA